MSIMANDDSVTLVVVPSNSLLDQLLPIIKEWTSEGLLGRFLIISSDQVIENEGESLRVNASIIVESNGEMVTQEIDAFEQLAQHEFAVVRLVALRVLQEVSTISTKENELLGKVSDYVARILPMANARMNETQLVTRFLRLNLVVAPTESHSKNFETAFMGNWDMHIVASPEDRSTPWAADALVRNDQRFLRFVLMHLASTGGLWNGLGTSPFELVEKERAKEGGKWLSRVFVNAILTEGLAKRVAAGVLNDIASATKDIYDARIAINVPGTQIIEPALVDQYVDWMVGQTFLIENAVLEFKRPETIERIGKMRWMEWDQIKNFLHFSWDKLKVVPWWMYIWFRRLIGRKLTKTFHADEGLAEVGISQTDPMDLRDRNLAAKLSSIKTRAAEAKREMNSPLSQRGNRGSAKLWSSIRRIVFGMMDGSDLTDFGIEEVDGRVPIFSRTSQIVADPSQVFAIPKRFATELGESEISWGNLERAEEFISVTQAKISELTSEKLNAISRIEAYEAQALELREELENSK